MLREEVATMQPKTPVTCSICKRRLPRRSCVPNSSVRPALAELVQKSNPDWGPEGFTCLEDLNKQRAEYVQRKLSSGVGALSRLDADVAQAFKDEQLISSTLMEEAQQPGTFGQQM